MEIKEEKLKSEGIYPINTKSGEDSGNESKWLFLLRNLTVSKEIQIGDLLTSLVIIFSFLGWLSATMSTASEKERNNQKSESLRYLLKILREEDEPMSLTTLKNEFESDSRKKQRESYCGDFEFKSYSEFEASIYRLDWEGRIDFVSKDEIVFRLPYQYNSNFDNQSLERNDHLELIGIKEIEMSLLEKINKEIPLEYYEYELIKRLENSGNLTLKNRLVEIARDSVGTKKENALEIIIQYSQ